jgi:hypothetical protein
MALFGKLFCPPTVAYGILVQNSTFRVQLDRPISEYTMHGILWVVSSSSAHNNNKPTMYTTLHYTADSNASGGYESGVCTKPTDQVMFLCVGQERGVVQLLWDAWDLGCQVRSCLRDEPYGDNALISSPRTRTWSTWDKKSVAWALQPTEMVPRSRSQASVTEIIACLSNWQEGQTYSLKCSVFWDITSCGPLKLNRCFGVTCRLHLHSWRISLAELWLYFLPDSYWFLVWLIL